MLDQLEKEANDDFLLLESVGPEVFSTEHLLELRDGARLRLRDYDRRNRVNVAIGVLVFGWLMAFFYAYAYNNIWLAIAAVVGLIFSLVACIAGIFLLVRMYRSRIDLEYTLRKIEQELYKR